MNDSIRLFVAAPIPEKLKAELGELLQAFEHPAIRFMPPQNLHLTLYFIGNVPPQELPRIQEQLQTAAHQYASFTLQLDALELGPKPHAPRLVWARFAPNPVFEALSRHLVQALAPEPAQPLKTIPHITLARFRKDAPKPAGLPPVHSPTPLQLPVSSFSLWQSELASPHPIYRVLQNYPLS
ncbi:RNA 2',3'-cyclic phosphodiesterase [Pontibacter liquoris]|uniref:RNA 2',3'-cyclic phosphodiesterase n=1 Tax=Pontibacter liquoris TaxID=2905677 RepID=UPI001FA6FAA6|nr:RNA 2',3'-cyclic phosphodiesterase [Pontibacter liquoris]